MEPKKRSSAFRGDPISESDTSPSTRNFFSSTEYTFSWHNTPSFSVFVCARSVHMEPCTLWILGASGNEDIPLDGHHAHHLLHLLTVFRRHQLQGRRSPDESRREVCGRDIGETAGGKEDFDFVFAEPGVCDGVDAVRLVRVLGTGTGLSVARTVTMAMEESRHTSALRTGWRNCLWHLHFFVGPEINNTQDTAGFQTLGKPCDGLLQVAEMVESQLSSGGQLCMSGVGEGGGRRRKKYSHNHQVKIPQSLVSCAAQIRSRRIVLDKISHRRLHGPCTTKAARLFVVLLHHRFGQIYSNDLFRVWAQNLTCSGLVQFFVLE